MTRNNSNAPFFFSVKHIIKPHTTKIIYGVYYQDRDYFILKTHSTNDCEQLDGNPRLEPEVFARICHVISEIEKGYKKTPPLENINIDIFNLLEKGSFR
jgi:hypothetical protein